MKFYKNIFLNRGKLYISEYANGANRIRKVSPSPRLFVESEDKTIQSKYKSFDGVPLIEMPFEKTNEFYDFLKSYTDLMPVYGSRNLIYDFISREYPNIKYDERYINVGYIDIEVRSDEGMPDSLLANKEILSITISLKDDLYVFGLKPFKPHMKNVKYIQCPTEKDMLTEFLHFVKDNSYDVFTGWYIREFDIPYIVRRCARVLSEETTQKMLSPFGNIENKKTVLENGKVIDEFIIAGTSILDYLELYLKYGQTKLENYRLNTVAHYELGEKKIDYSEYSSLNELYEKDHQKYIEYNIHDVLLIMKLEEKKKLLSLSFNLAYTSGVLYPDVFRQTRMWEAITYQYLLNKKNIVPKINPRQDKDKKFEGAFVQEPNVGKYNWCVSFDIQSMYPHIIMGYNISPDVYIKKLDLEYTDLLEDKNKYLPVLKNMNLSMCANGTIYKKDKKGFLPEIIETLFEERAMYKNKAKEAEKLYNKTKDSKYVNEIATNDILQNTKKVCLNSAFGAIGNPGFRFFNVDMAEAITITGKFIILYIQNRINKVLNSKYETALDYVIYMDTDSIYVDFEEIVKRECDGLDTDGIKVYIDTYSKNVIQPILNKIFDDIAALTNAYEQKMFMKREKICNRGVFIAKKNYILNVLNNEGVDYNPPKSEFVGVEAIRSTTPEKCRDALKKSLQLVLLGTEQELQDYIKNFKKEFKTFRFEEISISKSCDGVTKYANMRDLYAKGTPIHVRGAILYNHLLKLENLEHKYETIKNGEKISYCYLTMPNRINENVIAVKTRLPEEFKLHNNIDYETQFEKVFINPIDRILSIIGWRHEPISTLGI